MVQEMLHELTSSYREIAKCFPELKGKLPTVTRRKQILLEIASNGKQKPNTRTKIGMVLYKYTSKKSPIYDCAFTEKIEKLAPQWLTSKVDKNKQRLLSIAESGGQKPSRTSCLGGAFRRYVYKKSISHDPKFVKKITELAPNWIPSKFFQVAKKKKQQLLAIAATGRRRPSKTSPLGAALDNYRYDLVFMKKIKKLAPHWFKNTQQKKRALLGMATKKKPRPNGSTPLGEALSRYTCKSSRSYDRTLTREIKKLAPHWFQKRIVK